MGADLRCVIGTFSLGEERVHPATCERPMAALSNRHIKQYIYSKFPENMDILRNTLLYFGMNDEPHRAIAGGQRHGGELYGPVLQQALQPEGHNVCFGSAPTKQGV